MALRILTDERYIEHDCYLMIESLILPMQGYYVDRGDNQLTMHINRIWERTREIMPDFIHHLQHLEIEPSIVLIRWIRLLLSRELSIPQVFFLWDRLFLQPTPAFPLLEYLATGLLLALHSTLCSCTSIQEVLEFLQRSEKEVNVRYLWTLAKSLWEVCLNRL